jgi:hypothetical protein
MPLPHPTALKLAGFALLHTRSETKKASFRRCHAAVMAGEDPTDEDLLLMVKWAAATRMKTSGADAIRNIALRAMQMLQLQRLEQRVVAMGLKRQSEASRANEKRGSVAHTGQP